MRVLRQLACCVVKHVCCVIGWFVMIDCLDLGIERIQGEEMFG